MNQMQSGVGNAFSDWGLGAASDPEVYSTLTPVQQGWVDGGLEGVKQRALAAKQAWPAVPGSPDGTRPAAVGGFQQWYNAGPAKTMPVKPLRTDGLLDQDTLEALKSMVSVSGGAPYPAASTPLVGTTCPKGQSVDPKTSLCVDDKLSTGAIVGIAAVGAVVVGGIAYAMTGKKRRKSKGRKKGRR